MAAYPLDKQTAGCNSPHNWLMSLTIPGISDHEIIYLASSIEVQLTKMSKCKILVWSGADITTIKSIALNFNTCFLKKHSMTSPVNTLRDEFQDMCQRCLDLILILELIATSRKNLAFPLTFDGYSAENNVCTTAKSSQSPFY